MANTREVIPNNNNLAIDYLRYSSHAQSDASIQQQRDAAKKYAAANGLTIIKEYKDEAMSGTTDQRPQFQQMLAEISKLKPAVLIVWKTDRLGRDRYDLAIAKKIIRDAGCRIHYIAEPVAGDTPEGLLLEGILESMAEFYSRQLRTNIRRGHLFNAENCLFNGHKILGYTTEPAPEYGKDRKRYVIDPKTAPLVQKIFEEYVEGKPMVDIAKELNSQGWTSMQGKPFTVNSLAHILRHRAYIGEYRYADVFKPDGMPVIISKELFESAQKKLIQNKRQGGQRANGLTPDGAPRFWLTGKLYCGVCGSPMQGYSGTSKTKAKHYYYSCPDARKKNCSLKKYIQKRKIEDIICNILAFYLSDSENLASLAVDTAAYFQKECADHSYIDGLVAEEKKVQKALDNLLKAVEQGIFSETTQNRLLELESQKKALAAAIETEEMKHAMLKNEISIQHFFRKYTNADFDDPAVRDYILDYFVDKIFIYNDKIVITAWYGDDKREVRWSDISVEIEKYFNNGVNMVEPYLGKGSSASEVAPPRQFKAASKGPP